MSHDRHDRRPRHLHDHSRGGAAGEARPVAPAPNAPVCTDRRRFLRLGGAAAAVCLAGPVLHQLGGCADQGEEAAPTALRIPVAELPEGVRVRRELAGKPIEILRTGDQVVARSLLCTHQGCEVAWRPEDREYFCPCHEGRFGPDGQVIEGMPPRPLRTYPVAREGDVVVIGS